MPVAEQGHSEERYARRWWVLLATSLALFMVILDSTVVNVSVPSIIRELHASLSQAEWALNAYTLVFASLLVTFGRLGDMFGRRRMFVLGTAIFGLGSLACALAPSPGVLIAFRAFQATGSAFMLPATLSLTTVNFPPEERGRALGVWGSVSGVALGVGPAIGGFLTQFSWRYVFVVNLPVVAFAIPFTLWAVPRSREAGRHRIDFAGVALSVAMFATFCYGMIEGPTFGWANPVIVISLAGAVALFALFLVRERTAAEPLVDLRLFRQRTATAGNVAAALLLFGMFGVFFLMPLFLQNALGFGALATGLALTPLSLAMMVVAPFSGRLSDRVGSRWPAFAGLALAAVGVAWMSVLSRSTTPASLAPRYVLTGLGMGLVLAPVTSAVMGTAPPGEEGAVSGILATMRQVGGVLGVAILGAVLQATAVANLPASSRQVASVQPAVAEKVAVEVVLAQGGFATGTGGFTVNAVARDLPPATYAPIAAAAVDDAIATLPAAEVSRVGVANLRRWGAEVAAAEAGTLATGVVETGGASEVAFEAAVRTALSRRLAVLSRQLAGAVQTALIAATRATFLVAAVVMALGALVALLIEKGPNRPTSSAESV